MINTRLKELRVKHNLTQQQLADLAEVSRQTISSIEKGGYIPSVRLALSISRYLKSTVEYIFQDT